MINKHYKEAAHLKPGDKFLVPSAFDIECFYEAIKEEEVEDTVGWTNFTDYANTQRTVVKIEENYDNVTHEQVFILLDTNGLWWDSRMVTFEKKPKNPCISW